MCKQTSSYSAVENKVTKKLYAYKSYILRRIGKMIWVF